MQAASSGAPQALPETVKTASDLDGAADRWMNMELFEAARDWIAQRLTAHDGRAVDSVRHAQVRPWGLVLRVDAAGETFWFKANAEGGAHEGALMRWLDAQIPGKVPATVAVDLERRWWLAADAGETLAGRAGSSPVPLPAWRQVLREYADLQRQLESSVSRMPSVGIPRHPPAKAPQQFAELLEDPGRLLVGDKRGLSRDEYRELRRLVPAFTRWCEELDSAGIPLTIQHDDLSDANVCHNRNGLTIIDWADAHVGHPFGSLIFPLRTFREQHGLPVGHPKVIDLADTYLEAWSDLSDRESLRHLKDLAVRVGVVSKALSWTRALLGLDRTALNAYYASPEARWLRKLLQDGLPY
ncbi:phosphotransferase [Streptomyces phaeochromogenes]|uniref:phosphotransferase n=1 Tax=Streptomyces phaeochromogenes TaxID=1923 RepID=UPI0037134C85